jgi:hypothetical protein
MVELSPALDYLARLTMSNNLPIHLLESILSYVPPQKGVSCILAV